jgi:hypothetical protein
MMCGKCKKCAGILMLIFGLLFLLQNLRVWTFWGIQWYTVLFIIAGFGMIGRSCCKECNAGCCQTDMKSKPETKPKRR